MKKIILMLMLALLIPLASAETCDGLRDENACFASGGILGQGDIVGCYRTIEGEDITLDLPFQSTLSESNIQWKFLNNEQITVNIPRDRKDCDDSPYDPNNGGSDGISTTGTNTATGSGTCTTYEEITAYTGFVPDEISETNIFKNVLKREGPCKVKFNPIKSGLYLLAAFEGSRDDYSDGTFIENTVGYIVIQVDDILEKRSFGHQCHVVDTSLCGDISSYGDISASGSILATDIYAEDVVQVLGELTIGINQVRFSPANVVLPATTINGLFTLNSNLILASTGSITSSTPDTPVTINDALAVTGSILGGSDGLLQISDNVEVGTPISPRTLVVHGSTSLNQVDSIQNANGAIDVNSDLSVMGDIVVADTQGIVLGGERRTAWQEAGSSGIENLISNPGFEIGLNDWSVWGSPTVQINTNPDDVYHGSGSLHVITTGSNQGVTQTISGLVSGREYTLSARVKGNGAVIRVADNSPVDFAVSGYSSESGWYLFKETFTPDTTVLTIHLGRTTAGSNGIYYFDDIQLEEGNIASKFRPRTLTFEGDAEFRDVSANDVTADGTLAAMNGATITNNLLVEGNTRIEGEVRSTGDVVVTGNVIASEVDSRIMGPVNLRKACDASSPRMFTENGDFVIDLGISNQCSTGQPCVENSDCVSSSCNQGTGVCN